MNPIFRCSLSWCYNTYNIFSQVWDFLHKRYRTVFLLRLRCYVWNCYLYYFKRSINSASVDSHRDVTIQSVYVVSQSVTCCRLVQAEKWERPRTLHLPKEPDLVTLYLWHLLISWILLRFTPLSNLLCLLLLSLWGRNKGEMIFNWAKNEVYREHWAHR